MIELPRAAIEDGLKDGTLDVAVMLVSNLQDREFIASETLFRSRRRLWLPVEHPLLHADSIDLADVAGAPYIMLSVDEANQTASRYWAPSGLDPNVIFTTSSVEAVRSMVADGLGLTILSDMVYRPWSLEGQRIEQRNLATPIPTMDVGLAWRKAEKLGRAAAGLRRFPRPVGQRRSLSGRAPTGRVNAFASALFRERPLGMHEEGADRPESEKTHQHVRRLIPILREIDDVTRRERRCDRRERRARVHQARGRPRMLRRDIHGNRPHRTNHQLGAQEAARQAQRDDIDVVNPDDGNRP